MTDCRSCGEALGALVLTPRQAAAILGVSHQTIRRWIADGACPNAFATLPGRRCGVPAWWVEERTNAGRLGEQYDPSV